MHNLRHARRQRSIPGSAGCSLLRPRDNHPDRQANRPSEYYRADSFPKTAARYRGRKRKLASRPGAISPQIQAAHLRRVSCRHANRNFPPGISLSDDNIEIIRRIPRGCTPDPAENPSPGITRCICFNSFAVLSASNATRSFPLCWNNLQRPAASDRLAQQFDRPEGHEAVARHSRARLRPASVSSTISLSIKLDPGIDGPPV